MLIDLFNKDTNALVGSITEAELQHLFNFLESESDRDDDFFIEPGTIDLLGTDGLATEHLLKVLRTAVGKSEGVDVRWERRDHSA